MRLLIVIFCSVLLIVLNQYLNPYDNLKVSYVYLLALSGSYMIIPVAIFVLLYNYLFKTLIKRLRLVKGIILSFGFLVISYTVFLLLYSVLNAFFFDYEYGGSISYLIGSFKTIFLMYFPSVIIIFLVYHAIEFAFNREIYL